VHDRVEPLEVRRIGVADVEGALLVPGDRGAEVAPVVPPGVETDDLVTRPDEDRDENLTDESTVARDKYSHAEPTPMNEPPGTDGRPRFPHPERVNHTPLCGPALPDDGSPIGGFFGPEPTKPLEGGTPELA